jgi:hypothetical protein
MQTKITDKDFYKSASNLTRQHLGAQIYEGIHILASLLDCNDKLVNPKRNVKNHPASRLWIGYEYELLFYIERHLDEWCVERGYKSNINDQNFFMLCDQKYERNFKYGIKNLDWITDELIQTHRSVLIQKEIEKEIDLKKDLDLCEYANISLDIIIKIKEKINNCYHYRNLWPNTPTNLKMRYDWRTKC